MREGMGLQDEYAAIVQGMQLGTLRPAPVDKPPDTWIAHRFSLVSRICSEIGKISLTTDPWRKLTNSAHPRCVP